MSRVLASLLLLLAGQTAAQLKTFPATPLASMSFPRPSDLPYQVDQGNLARGNQSGYNQCNSTTQGQSSLCQTSYVNDLSDFCLWAPQAPNSVLGDAEGDVVAWCTQPGHGTRVIPPGALRGVQLLKTPDYVMLTGLVNQTLINMAADDFGGELDPHGQDLRGNPIGGIMYSTQFSNGTGPAQVVEWTNFMGSMMFCIKICDANGPAKKAAGYCQHTLDRIGCAYNAPSKYTVGSGFAPGEFEACESDNMAIPGEYVENGQTLSYKQPPESLGPINTLPYDPSIPPSSKCTTTASAALYAAASASTTAAASTSGAGQTAGASASSTGATASATAAGAGQPGSAIAMGGSVGAVALGVFVSLLVM